MDKITLPVADDMHVHLRQDEMLARVAPMVASGGIGRCIVMPNTIPPTNSIDSALTYRDALAAVMPGVEVFPTIYLTPALVPDQIEAVKQAGVIGIKCYPRGVTTNSESGVEDLAVYDPVFAAMEAAGMVLLIHGEVPSNDAIDVCIMNAEQRFLPELERLHRCFPRLRMVLEHVSSRAAVACVKGMGDTVGATVTPHHLDLTIDDWATNIHNFCKPAAKCAHDRDAIRAAVAEGHPRFFLGSDSAPHPRASKECLGGKAGIFTTPLLLPYVADTLDRIGALERLPDFVAAFGAAFYGLPQNRRMQTLVRQEQVVPPAYGDVVPFRSGETLGWTLEKG
jgi:dihydroorotase